MHIQKICKHVTHIQRGTHNYIHIQTHIYKQKYIQIHQHIHTDTLRWILITTYHWHLQGNMWNILNIQKQYKLQGIHRNSPAQMV